MEGLWLRSVSKVDNVTWVITAILPEPILPTVEHTNSLDMSKVCVGNNLEKLALNLGLSGVFLLDLENC